MPSPTRGEPVQRMLRPMYVTRRHIHLVLLAALALTGCQDSDENGPSALGSPSTGSPALEAPASPEVPRSGSCDEGQLETPDATRLAVYRAALRQVLRGQKELAYLANRPVLARGVPAQAQARQATFSRGLLACLAAGTEDLPPLQPVAGFQDKRVIKSGGGSIPRLSEGRLVEFSGLDPQSLRGPAVVFVSLNGGGGFDYLDRTMRLELVDGQWAATKDLGGAVA